MQKEIINHLTKIITRLLKNPLLFVSEADVHKFVMWELMKINELNLENLIETNCSIGKNSKGVPSTKKYKTTLLHSEYGNRALKKERSDIVILDIDDVKSINHPLDLKINNEWIIPDYILEFGTEKSAGNINAFEKHLKNDLRKTSKSNVKGFIIHLHRNYIKSTGKRLEKNEEKFKQYVQKYKEVIKDGKYPNIKIVIAIVDIGNDGRIVRGKIRLLKDPFGKPKLVRVELNKIEENILTLLK